MRLIAMSLYSRLDEQQIYLKNHLQNTQKLFDQLLRYFANWNNTKLYPIDILDETPLFILVSPTKGLCGGLNSNIKRYINKSLFIEEHQNPSFITIGQNVTDHAAKQDLGPILYQCNNLSPNNYTAIAEKIIQHIFMHKEPYSSVTCYSAHLKNFFLQTPEKIKLIPLNTSNTAESEKELFFSDSEPIWEQQPEKVAEYLAHKYLKSSICNLLFQSLLAENAARFVAMDGSTTNADNYLERLVLQFNKTRQGLITREVAELSSNL